MARPAGRGRYLTAQIGSGRFRLGVVDKRWNLDSEENDSADGSVRFDNGTEIAAFTEFVGDQLVTFSPMLNAPDLEGLFARSRHVDVTAMDTRFRMSLGG